MEEIRNRIKGFCRWLAGLGFRTGLGVLGVCIIFYILSFAQMALPIPVAWKGGLWVLFFGLAKAAQYSALLILGKEGILRIKRYLGRKI